MTVMALAALFGAAACNMIKTPTTPAPVAGAVSYSAIGASDAIGYGGSSPCMPFSDCPNGTGYVQTVARRLRADHPDMEFLNLGVPGTVLSREIQDIGNSMGRGIVSNFIDGQMPFVDRDATLVTVFAGGNDVNTIGSAVRARAASERASFAQTQIDHFTRDFATFIAGISERAPNAQIVVLNLPNMSRMPYAAGKSSDEREWLRTLSVSFSAGMNATRGSRVRVVDLMCHEPMYDGGIYSSDGFHPNDLGYVRMADLVTAAIAQAPSAPAAGCTFMY
jgi:lysophospholipase L1-like esterase